MIDSPLSHELDELCGFLADRSFKADATWPAEQLNACGRAGVFRWFLPPEQGGVGFGEVDVIRGYLKLSAACLTTTFIITQRTGALQRIAGGQSDELKEKLLPPLLAGEIFATVGISHLTTSRRHLGQPVLAANETTTGFRLDGYSPWVTGGAHADWVVVGAELADGRQVLAAVPTAAPGVETPQPPSLTALSGSATGQVQCQGVELPSEYILAGPIENVMTSGVGASTGGLQTSTLAIGLSRAAVNFLAEESVKRSDLIAPAEQLKTEVGEIEADLLALAAGGQPCTNAELRTRANSLVLRATQAALTAAKGAGFVDGHSAGRWCRQALFFLVWSCPQPVAAANLCQLAGLAE